MPPPADKLYLRCNTARRRPENEQPNQQERAGDGITGAMPFALAALKCPWTSSVRCKAGSRWDGPV
jgi:hypothetical protein